MDVEERQHWEVVMEDIDSLQEMTKRQAERLARRLGEDRWLGKEEAAQLSSGMLALEEKQAALQKFCRDQGIPVADTVSLTKAALRAWMAAQAEEAQRARYVAALETVASMVYTGQDEFAGTSIEALKAEAARILALSLTVTELAKKAARFVDLAAVVKSGESACQVLTDVCEAFEEWKMPLFFALTQKMLAIGPEKPAEAQTAVEKIKTESGTAMEEAEDSATPVEAEIETGSSAEGEAPVPDALDGESDLPKETWIATVDPKDVQIVEKPFLEKNSGAKRFISEVTKKTRGYTALAMGLIHVLSMEGVSELTDFSKWVDKAGQKTWTTEAVKNVLERLIGMGCVAQYTVKGHTFYVLTRGCCQAIRSSERVRKMLELDSLKNVGLLSNEEEAELYWRNFIARQWMNNLMEALGGESTRSQSAPMADRMVMRVTVHKEQETAAAFDIVLPLFGQSMHEAVRKGISAYAAGLSAEEKASQPLFVLGETKAQTEVWMDYFKGHGFENVSGWVFQSDGTLESVDGRSITAVLLKEDRSDASALPQKTGKPESVPSAEGSEIGKAKADRVPEESAAAPVEGNHMEGETAPAAENNGKASPQSEPVPAPQPEEKTEVVLPETGLEGAKKEETAAVPVAAKPMELESAPVMKAEAVPAEEPVRQEVPKARDRGTESVSVMLQTAAGELEAGHGAEGMLLLRGMEKRFDEPWMGDLIGTVGCIVNDPLCRRSAGERDGLDWWNTTIEMHGESGDGAEWLRCAALLRGYFDAKANDYRLQKSWSELNDSAPAVTEDVPALKDLMNFCLDFVRKHGLSLRQALTAAGHSEDWQEKQWAKAAEELKNAEGLRKNALRKNYNHKKVDALRRAIFGEEGDLALYLENGAAAPGEMLSYCRQFMKDGTESMEAADLIEQGDWLDLSKVDQWLDAAWDEAEPMGKYRRNQPLMGSYRKGIRKKAQSILQVMIHYGLLAQARGQQAGQRLSPEVLNEAKEKLHTLAEEAQEGVQALSASDGLDRLARGTAVYFMTALSETGKAPQRDFYDSILPGGYIEFDIPCVPDVDYDFGISDFDLYARTKQHIASRQEEKTELTVEEAYDGALGRGDLGLCRLLKENHPALPEVTDEAVRYGKKKLEREWQNFTEDLEMAVNYGQINIEKRDSLLSAGHRNKAHVEETENFGFFTAFRKACHTWILRAAIPQQKAVDAQLASMKEAIRAKGEDPSSLPITAHIEASLKSGNFTVAEDYIRKYTNDNMTDVPDVEGNLEGFENFLSSYDDCYKACIRSKGRGLKQIYANWKPRGQKGPSVRILQNRQDFTEQWSAMNKGRIETLTALFGNLSFNMEKARVKVLQQGNPIQGKILWEGAVPRQAHYKQPFAPFGTGAYENGLQFLIFFGDRDVDSLISEVTKAKLDVSLGTICLLDAALSLAERREMARKMKLNVNMRNVLVVDRVLALYLTKEEQGNRGDLMLRLALPFASVSPYMETGPIPPEMFMGREKEIADIRDMRGPSIIYGGRQLGKSAILRQVCYLEHCPEEGQYAFYFDIRDDDSEKTLNMVTKELQGQGFLSRKADSWDDFCDLLRDKFRDGMKKCILLLDEADALLAKDPENQAIQALTKLQNSEIGAFKFVLAGLHNVLRFDKRRLGGNTVLAQLSSLTVRPFSYLEASELLLKPLSYMGFALENTEVLSTILAGTNYFPGLIQLYGKKLIEAGAAYQRGQFNDSENPPYWLDEKYLRSVQGDDSFRTSLRNKFMITLELDTDNCYRILAYALAWYYHAFGPTPVMAADVAECCEAYDIRNRELMDASGVNYSEEKIEAYMTEMVEMNLLRKAPGGGFIFNQYSFFTLLGSEEHVEKELKDCAAKAMER